MNGYELSRIWFDFCFENPEKIKPNHTALYFFAIEHCNRLGWKEKFGLPTTMVKEAIGIKSYNTYVNTLNDLVDWGFLKMIERSKNQYSANIIALSKFNKALDKALDKALIKHSTKQSESTSESIDSIDKQLTIEQYNNKQKNPLKVFRDDINSVYDLVVDLFPVSTQPTTQKQIDNWKDEIRKLIDLDGYDIPTIQHVVKVVRSDSFWCKNFLSIMKLRQLDKNGIKYIVIFIENFKKKTYEPDEETKRSIEHLQATSRQIGS